MKTIKKFFSQKCKFFCFALVLVWLHLEARQPVIEHRPTAVKALSTNHWTSRELPQTCRFLTDSLISKRARLCLDLGILYFYYFVYVKLLSLYIDIGWERFTVNQIGTPKLVKQVILPEFKKHWSKSTNSNYSPDLQPTLKEKNFLQKLFQGLLKGPILKT